MVWELGLTYLTWTDDDEIDWECFPRSPSTAEAEAAEAYYQKQQERWRMAYPDRPLPRFAGLDST